MKEEKVYVVQQRLYNFYEQEYDKILGIFKSKERAETCKKMHDDAFVIETFYTDEEYDSSVRPVSHSYSISARFINGTIEVRHKLIFKDTYLVNKDCEDDKWTACNSMSIKGDFDDHDRYIPRSCVDMIVCSDEELSNSEIADAVDILLARSAGNPLSVPILFEKPKKWKVKRIKE